MSVKFILGPSGEERSKKIYEYAIEAASVPERKVYVIVPEQYTLDTQKGLVNAHPRHALLNIDIVSFERLAYKILGKTGASNNPLIRDSGKSMIIRKVINNNKSSFKYFAPKTKKRGLVSEMKSLISELDQYGVSSDDLAGLSGKFYKEKNERIAGKLDDIRLIFDAFHEEINKRFITQEELLDVLKKKIDETGILNGCSVFFDGYTGFTTTQYRLLESIIRQADEVGVSVAYEGETTHSGKADALSGNLFFMSDDFINKCIDAASKAGKKSDEYIFCGDGESASPELEFLKHNLFIRENSGNVFEGEPDSIHITETADAAEEVSLVINKIYDLTRKQGMRYRDIAIVAEDLEIYGDMLIKMMQRNGFPAFLDERKSVSENAYIEHIRALLQIIIKGWTYENIFRFLKTGFLGFTNEEIDLIDNYCLATGVNNKSAWKKEWVYPAKKKKKDADGSRIDYYDLEVLNSYREKIYDLINTFEKAQTKSESTGERTKILRDYLRNASVVNHVNAISENTSDEIIRIAEKMGDIFDEIDELFGNEETGLDEFAEILDAAFEELSLGFIPPTVDCITIGDVNRTRLTDIKALFVVGVNDGVLPKKNTDSGILTSADRLKISENDITLAPSVTEKSFIQKFYLYLLFTKPFEKLFISYARKDTKGDGILPSYLIKDIKEMFPGLKVKGVEAKEKRNFNIWLPESKTIWTPESGPIQLSKEASNLLYGGELRGSVSSLERFAGCPFMFFASSGLKLSPRERYEFNTADFGTVVHDVLRRIMVDSIAGKTDIFNLSDDELEHLVTAHVEEASADYRILNDTGRKAFIKKRIHELSRVSIKTIMSQLSGGSFRPHLLEHSFNIKRDIPGAGSLIFNGKIDRIDIAENGDNVFVSVVDYKTGTNDFDIGKAYYGRQIQLINYLIAATHEEQKYFKDKKIVPASMFYYITDNPYIDIDKHESDDDSIEKEIKNALSMKGIADSDGDIQALMSNEAAEESVYFKGTKTNQISRDDMDALFKFETDKMNRMAADILKGDVDINPLLDDAGQNGDNACEYCDYKDICNFSRDVTGCRSRKYRHLKSGEFWELIRQGKDNE